jgi:hypothetical protein
MDTCILRLEWQGIIGENRHCRQRYSFPPNSTGPSLPIHDRIVSVRRSFHSLRSYLDTNFIGLFMRLLEDEIDHLSDLIGRHVGDLFYSLDNKWK